MGLVTYLLTFGAGITFTILLELRGLSELLSPLRDMVTAVQRVLP